MTPFKRLFNLLELDRKDILQLFFYAIFAGIMGLSLPLGIQSIINFIQSGRVSVSWIVLVFIVVGGVAFMGLLNLMQLRITENLQQKIFTRSSFEFAYRMPKIKFEEMDGAYPPELANRFFDTLTIQKGVSKLLIDFSAALLQIIFGLLLLSLYHSFFILYGFMLFGLLYIILKFSFQKGVDTSLKESKAKYYVAGWIQEMGRNNYSFRKSLNFDFALNKNDRFVTQYLGYREEHYNVIKTQYKQLIFFKVLITASLLLVGGYLVINQKMNIGQFVAAEIIILLIITSVEKLIVGLSTLYDVLTSVEKIGQITDLPTETDSETVLESCFVNITLQTENLDFQYPLSTKKALRKITLKIDQGEKIFLEGSNGSGKTSLLRILAGMLHPTYGSFYINDDTFKKIDLKEYRSNIGVIVDNETPFEGTILENITFRDPNVDPDTLKWALDALMLTPFIKTLPKGLETQIYQEGRQLSSSHAQKILLARSIVQKPRILFYEDPTDKMDLPIANKIIDFLMDPAHPWTLIVSSRNPYWKEKASRYIHMENGRIISDNNKS